MKEKNVKVLVRLCDVSYDDNLIKKAGIEVKELTFPDGKNPPKAVVNEWLALVRSFSKSEQKLTKEKDFSNYFQKDSPLTVSHNSETLTQDLTPVNMNVNKNSPKNQEEGPGRIAVHCLAGLGRAPVLVALALIDHGMKPELAIKMLRDARPGALNLQ